MRRDAIYWAERAERGIYWTVGTILVLSAAVFLVYTIREAVVGYSEGHFASATIRAFDRSLLTLMLAQIVYTTMSYLRQGKLQVEPVLVVGIIAVVRRILVLTAVVSGTSGDMGLVLTFEQSMIELGLLALTVLVLAVAVYLVRKPARQGS
jgi:uncharacterized membrane protein (DUF373 family)